MSIQNSTQSSAQHPARRGLLISFEGGEGAGKTTQIAKLKEKLTQEGHEVMSLREPGGTFIGEQIREVVLSTKNAQMSFETEVLLFQAARAQIYAEVVLPALKASKIILMDRTRDSSVIYQGMVRNFGSQLIEQLNNISTQNTYPDLTFLLDVPVETGLKRREQAGAMNRIDLEKNEFHERVRNSYLEWVKADTLGRWQVIDASQSFDEVQNEILRKIHEKLGKSA